MDTKPTLELIAKYWPTRLALAAAMALAFTAVGAIVKLFEIERPIAIAFLAIAEVATLSLWLANRRIPTPRHGRKGFAIALKLEDANRDSVTADFIGALRQHIGSGATAGIFDVLVVPQHACDIYDDGDAARLLHRARSTFLLVGTVRRRLIGGKEHEIVQLRGMVSHAPISVETAATFGREFTELLSPTLRIDADSAVLGFEFAATTTGAVAKYIIAIAAALSSELDYSESLFNDLFTQPHVTKSPFPIFARIRQRIPTHLSQIAFARAQAVLQRWRETRDPALMREVACQVQVAKDRGFGEPNWVSTECLCKYVNDDDPQAALRLLEKQSKANRTATWYLNKAYLAACLGDLKRASTAYAMAEKQMGIEELQAAVIVDQIEEFLLWRTQLTPNRPELWYCLGVVNRQLKADFAQSLKDFRRFLDCCVPDQYSKECELVREKWIPEMETQLARAS